MFESSHFTRGWVVPRDAPGAPLLAAAAVLLVAVSSGCFANGLSNLHPCGGRLPLPANDPDGANNG